MRTPRTGGGARRQTRGASVRAACRAARVLAWTGTSAVSRGGERVPDVARALRRGSDCACGRRSDAGSRVASGSERRPDRGPAGARAPWRSRRRLLRGCGGRARIRPRHRVLGPGPRRMAGAHRPRARGRGDRRDTRAQPRLELGAARIGDVAGDCAWRRERRACSPGSISAATRGASRSRPRPPQVWRWRPATRPPRA